MIDSGWSPSPEDSNSVYNLGTSEVSRFDVIVRLISP